MCIAFILFDLHPQLLLLLAFNRDEYYTRPTRPAHFWEDHSQVLGGRDMVGNGTWLGMTRHGRFACLTNHREPKQEREVHTRGELTTDFLLGDSQPLEYLQRLVPRLGNFDGFNLLVGHLGGAVGRQGGGTDGDGAGREAAPPQLAYVSNRDPGGPRPLPPGLYGLSNGLLMAWPKVSRGLAILEEVLGQGAAGGGQGAGGGGQQQAAAGEQAAAAAAAAAGAQAAASDAADAGGAAGAAAAAAAAAAGVGGGGGEDVPWDALFRRLLGDKQPAADEELPLTGVGRQLDALLSPIFVDQLPMAEYGTRSQTVMAVWRDGRAELRERHRDHEAGGEWREVRHELRVDPAAAAAAAAAAASDVAPAPAGRDEL